MVLFRFVLRGICRYDGRWSWACNRCAVGRVLPWRGRFTLGRSLLVSGENHFAAPLIVSPGGWLCASLLDSAL